jgi:hypothetical protein
MFVLVGSLSSFLFILCLGGLIDQIIKIIKKRKAGIVNVTRELSLNQFFSSYLSFYGFFIYSFLLEQVNFFLFSTRFGACLLTAAVIYLISLDRKKNKAILANLILIFSIILAYLLFKNKTELADIAKNGTQILIVISTILLLQGGLHQILIIRQKKSVGVLSFKMSFVFCLKDIANCLFGLTIGFADGWPLILMGSVSGLIKAAILFHFYWVKKASQHL